MFVPIKMLNCSFLFSFCLKSKESGGGGVLCGVMRIGLVAKGLLIKGDMDLELVLMCRDKPTQTLLDTVCLNLPTQIEVRDTHTHVHGNMHIILLLVLSFSICT